MKFKLFVFDLDETLWTVSEGLCTLVRPPFRLETPDRLVGKDGLWIELFPGARDLLKFLQKKKCYASIASRNDAAPTLELLEALGVKEYFQFPQLCWKPKEDSIKKIIKDIQKRDKVTIKPEEVLFVDDWTENVTPVRRWGASGLVFGQDVHSFEELMALLK
jgi:magnesium-dependent phosphatase-1